MADKISKIQIGNQSFELVAGLAYDEEQGVILHKGEAIQITGHVKYEDGQLTVFEGKNETIINELRVNNLIVDDISSKQLTIVDDGGKIVGTINQNQLKLNNGNIILDNSQLVNNVITINSEKMASGAWSINSNGTVQGIALSAKDILLDEAFEEYIRTAPSSI